MDKRKVKGQTAVIGTIIFLIAAIFAFSVFTLTMGAQVNYNAEAAQKAEFLATRAQENLYAFYNGTSNEIVIANTGSVVSTVVDFVLVKGTQMQLVPADIVVQPTSSIQISASSYLPDSFASYTKVGLLTSYGNVFWVAPGPFLPSSGGF